MNSIILTVVIIFSSIFAFLVAYRVCWECTQCGSARLGEEFAVPVVSRWRRWLTVTHPDEEIVVAWTKL
jgi:hypothetical protein